MDPMQAAAVDGMTQPQERADDMTARVSEGELVIPADVVRFFGADKFIKMIEQSRAKMTEMGMTGQIQPAGNGQQPAMADGGLIMSANDPFFQRVQQQYQQMQMQSQPIKGNVDQSGALGFNYVDANGKLIPNQLVGVGMGPQIPGIPSVGSTPGGGTDTPGGGGSNTPGGSSGPGSANEPHESARDRQNSDANGRDRLNDLNRNASFGSQLMDLGMADDAATILGTALGIPGAGLIMGGIENANNVTYRNNVRKGLGMEPLSLAQKVGGVLGLNDLGSSDTETVIGNLGINGNQYTVNNAGLMTNNGKVTKTTLTPREAAERLARSNTNPGLMAPKAPAAPTRTSGEAVQRETVKPKGSPISVPKPPSKPKPAAKPVSKPAPKKQESSRDRGYGGSAQANRDRYGGSAGNAQRDKNTGRLGGGV